MWYVITWRMQLVRVKVRRVMFWFMIWVRFRSIMAMVWVRVWVWHMRFVHPWSCVCVVLVWSGVGGFHHESV